MNNQEMAVFLPAKQNTNYLQHSSRVGSPAASNSDTLQEAQILNCSALPFSCSPAKLNSLFRCYIQFLV